jgi:starch synthase
VKVVHNGVDLSKYVAEHGDVRASLGIPQGKTVILFAGQISPLKGTLNLMKAFSKIADDSLHLVIAGSSTLWQTVDWQGDDYQSEYEKQVRALSANLPVQFLGKIAAGRMPQVYQAADIFVCPSVWPEPFGMVNIEAMAAGKPVIASRVGGIPEIVVDGETGIMVEPDDPDALATALRNLIDDPSLRAQMGRAGYQRAVHQFTWEKMLDELNALYQQL